MPAIAAKPLRDRTEKLCRHNPKNPVMTAAFFSGCNMDFVFPDTGESVVKVLQDLNIAVTYPQEQTCCGKPVLGMGDRETGKVIAKQNIEALEAAQADVIISACPTCAEPLERTHKELFKDAPEWRDRAAALAGKVSEFTSFAAEQYKNKDAACRRLSVASASPTMITVI